jgi:uncharacterized membrane protein (UPF0182 family)
LPVCCWRQRDLGKNADFLNDMVRKYIVAPNQIARERPYIDANIRSTLAAFGLDAVQPRISKPNRNPLSTPTILHW